MNASDFAANLGQCHRDAAEFTPDVLAAYWGLPPRCFHQTQTDGAIVFYPGTLTTPAAHLLRGTIFWPKSKRIVRGHPRVFPLSDYCTEPYQIAQETLFADAAARGEVTAEPKLYGVTIRVYAEGGALYCATNVSHDGGNPLVGAGIDNSRALGLDYGSQAARLVSERYPKIERLTRLGYVPVFVLQIPELAPDDGVTRADLVLVDAIDTEYQFVDRLEKERIAEDYDLSIVPLTARIEAPTNSVMPFLKRCRALEHQAAQQEWTGSAGVIIKARLDEMSDLLFCKAEPSSERDRERSITSSDLASVTEEINAQWDPSVWEDAAFIEELMLEYLDTHHRSARWRVRAYLENWRAARKLAGLG